MTDEFTGSLLDRLTNHTPRLGVSRQLEVLQRVLALSSLPAPRE